MEISFSWGDMFDETSDRESNVRILENSETVEEEEEEGEEREDYETTSNINNEEEEEKETLLYTPTLHKKRNSFVFLKPWHQRE